MICIRLLLAKQFELKADSLRNVIKWKDCYTAVSNCFVFLQAKLGVNNDTKTVAGWGNAIAAGLNYDWPSTILNVKGDGYNGNKLFKQNCTVCHVLTENVITGPELKNV